MKKMRVLIALVTAICATFYLYNAAKLYFVFHDFRQGTQLLVAGGAVSLLYFREAYLGLHVSQVPALAPSVIWKESERQLLLTTLAFLAAEVGISIAALRYAELLSYLSVLPLLLFYGLLLWLFRVWVHHKTHKNEQLQAKIRTLSLQPLFKGELAKDQLAYQLLQHSINLRLFSFELYLFFILILFLTFIISNSSSQFGISWMFLISSLIIFFGALVVCENSRLLSLKHKIDQGHYQSVWGFIKLYFAVPQTKMTLISTVISEYVIAVLYALGAYQECHHLAKALIFTPRIQPYVLRYQCAALIELGEKSAAQQILDQLNERLTKSSLKKRHQQLYVSAAIFQAYLEGENQVARALVSKLHSNTATQRLLKERLLKQIQKRD
ncbi:hypothetical protein KBX31_03505 [Liquorilactobacillus satsumensis]|uniref:hypothetical protein n=1 Tax=Liquorilactobacillus satsumensis TaxID=259059 RepID=UPI0021C2653B|nr:hypothetical protein [Liquorilactobacillus satsumensis]MCP9312366.1 hypothetical protein [Liquorilactobacillus satsumensis]MCP9327659.1 hypothetical protein [Liquorilactobacillus satsumensis]MCP9359630.1 hypothetical protein [Liquorilactobacillus satsumensis]